MAKQFFIKINFQTKQKLKTCQQLNGQSIQHTVKLLLK